MSLFVGIQNVTVCFSVKERFIDDSFWHIKERLNWEWENQKSSVKLD